MTESNTQLRSIVDRIARLTVESDVDLIMSALGVFVDTPLGQSAVDRAA